MRRPGRTLLGAAFLALALGGCQAQLDAALEPGDTQVIVGRRATGLTVEAPEWRPPETIVYLCPEAPTKTFEALADAGTISLSPDCRSYGTFDTGRGLTAELGYGALDAARRGRFEAASEWHLVLIGVRNGAVDQVFQTVVKASPIDPAITPGPSDPPSPAPQPSGSGTP